MDRIYKKIGKSDIVLRLGVVILFFSMFVSGCARNESDSITNTSDTLMEENLESQTQNNINQNTPAEDQGVSESTNTPTTSPIQPQAGTNWAEAPEAEQGPSEPAMTNSETPQDSTMTNTTP